MTEKLREAIRLYRIRSYHDALRILLAFDSSSPQTSIEIAYYAGLCYTQLDKFEEALLHFEQVVTSCDDVRRVHQCRLLLAVLYTQTGRIRLADFELRKLLETGCQTASVYCAMAYSAWMQKNPTEAIKLYQKALEVDSAHPTALNGLGYVFVSTGQELTRAFSLIKQAVEKYPNSPAYLDSLGWAYYKLGLTREARQFIKRARDILPNTAEIEEHFREVHKQLANNREENRLTPRESQ